MNWLGGIAATFHALATVVNALAVHTTPGAVRGVGIAVLVGLVVGRVRAARRGLEKRAAVRRRLGGTR